jgi:hypothetical protein
MLGAQEGDDGPVASTRNTARFETRQAFWDRTLRLGQLLAAYHCAVDIETKAINASVGGGRRAYSGQRLAA